jgi:5'-methylthioadenosine phosphorylase
MSKWVLGIVGGSGLYEIPGLEGEWRTIETPWGSPSDQLFDGQLNGVRVVFLPRHARGHKIPPHLINYRANVDALKRAGVTDILSVSACGSLREALNPGTFVAIDQYVDWTRNRASTFFDGGCVAHVSMAEPVCARLSSLAVEALRHAGARVIPRGTYLAMEGPQFSSRAESEIYRTWNCDVIGMTNMPEAKLAREAELPYASLCAVTDYDCWREGEAAVEVSQIVETMHANTAAARATIGRLTQTLAGMTRAPSPQNIETCLDFALITPPEARDPAALARLDAVAGRVLNR